MKKNLFLALVLAFTLVACDEDYTDWAQIDYSVDPETAETVEMNVQGLSGTIKMEEVESDSIQVFTGTLTSTTPISLVMELTSVDGETTTLPVSETGYVAKEDLKNAIITLYDKRYVVREVTAQLIAEADVNGAYTVNKSETFNLAVLLEIPEMNYWIYGKQNNRKSDEKTLPLMPVTKESQTVTTYFSGKLDTKLLTDETSGDASQAYGATGGNKNTLSGEFSIGGGYICPPSAGWYTLTFDFATYTYTFERLENQEPTEYASVSLIGDFTEGQSDLAMTQVSVSGSAWNSHCWYAQNVEMKEGGVKFRANNDWTVNWGTSVNVKQNAYGVGTQDGANITVPAGTYNVYFNDITGEFLFVAQ